jgi:hypothetical protein
VWLTCVAAYHESDLDFRHWLYVEQRLGLADHHGTGARSDGTIRIHILNSYYVFPPKFSPQMNKTTLSERVPG